VATAESTFKNDRYDDEPYGELDGIKLGRIQITRSFAGDLDGGSTAELLTATAPDGSAGYVAHDLITARLEGRSGSFVLQHTGLLSADGSESGGEIIPGSATGELAGLTGSGRISVDDDGTHHLTLDYELGPG
jgi:hypothetical protein